MSWRWAALAASVILMSACADPAAEQADEPVAEPTTMESTQPAPTPTPTEPTAVPTRESTRREGTMVIVDGSDYGPMLYSTEGQAIYLFDLESTPEPRCYGQCAEAWPPVLTKGDPVAAQGARAELLGTVEREDGTTQVTYAGHPLYFYAHEGPWQVLCHDIVEFGGTWLVVQPDGSAAP